MGLAANQIGVPLRVFVYDCPDDDGVRHIGHVVNPVLAAAAVRPQLDDAEGCLSVPGPHAELRRPGLRARSTGVDLHRRPITVDGTGYFARCLQHETDHLDGIVYVDRLHPRRRKSVLAAATLT